MLLCLYNYFRFCFRQIQTYSGIVQEHTQEHTHAYSEPWHIPITKHIQTPRYIHNTILNIFTKAPSCTFDTVLNAPVFYRCYLISLKVTSATKRYIETYIIETYTGIFKTYSVMFILVQAY